MYLICKNIYTFLYFTHLLRTPKLYFTRALEFPALWIRARVLFRPLKIKIHFNPCYIFSNFEIPRKWLLLCFRCIHLLWGWERALKNYYKWRTRKDIASTRPCRPWTFATLRSRAAPLSRTTRIRGDIRQTTPTSKIWSCLRRRQTCGLIFFL